MSIWQRLKNIWKWGEYKPSYNPTGAFSGIDHLPLSYPVIVKDGEELKKPAQRLATIITETDDHPDKQ